MVCRTNHNHGYTSNLPEKFLLHFYYIGIFVAFPDVVRGDLEQVFVFFLGLS